MVCVMELRSCKVGLGDALFADAKFGEAKTQYREALVLEVRRAAYLFMLPDWTE